MGIQPAHAKAKMLQCRDELKISHGSSEPGEECCGELLHVVDQLGGTGDAASRLCSVCGVLVLETEGIMLEATELGGASRISSGAKAW